MPLDLHVLGLPLAFILSQDQTLHRIFSNNISKPIRPLPIPQFKKSTLSLIVSVLHLYFCSSLVNDLFSPSGCLSSPLSHPLFPNGIAKVLLFSFPPNLFATFFRLFFAPGTAGRPARQPKPLSGTQLRDSGPRSDFFRCPNKKIVTRTDRRPHTEKDMPSTDGRHCVAPEGLSQEMPRLPIWGNAGQMEDAGPT